LAARLFIELGSSPHLPTTLDKQADWWEINYDPSYSAKDFVKMVSEFEETSGMTYLGVLIYLKSINSAAGKSAPHKLILLLCLFFYCKTDYSGKSSYAI